jgi:hypothetical protein
MERDNGDTEIAFLAAVALWLSTITFGWLANYFYLAWQNNEPYEFGYRATKILNFLPSSVHFFLVLIILAVFLYWSFKKTVKFVQLLRS